MILMFFLNHLNTQIILNIRNVTINALMNMFFLWSIWYAKSYWRETIHKWFFWVYYWGEICFVKNVRLLNVNANAYKCSECELNCSSKAELINHILDHSIYACDKCQYRNNFVQGLIAHAKIHSLKKFQCSKCDFKGTSTNSLNAHMKIHMDEIVHWWLVILLLSYFYFNNDSNMEYFNQFNAKYSVY